MNNCKITPLDCGGHGGVMQELTLADLQDTCQSADHVPPQLVPVHTHALAEDRFKGDLGDYWGRSSNGRLVRGRDDIDGLIDGGWQWGMEQVERLTPTFAAKLPAPRDIRRKMRWDGEGDEVSMEKVWNGDLDTAWRRPKRLSGYQPRPITLMVQWGGKCTLTPSELAWTPIVGVALAGRLIEAGYDVSLEAVSVSHYSAKAGQLCITRLRVKGHDEMLRVHGLTGAVIHPAAFRYYGLAMSAKSNNPQLNPGFGLNYFPDRLTTEVAIDLLREEGKLGTEVLLNIPRVYNEREALKLVDDLLDKLTSLMGMVGEGDT